MNNELVPRQNRNFHSSAAQRTSSTGRTLESFRTTIDATRDRSLRQFFTPSKPRSLFIFWFTRLRESTFTEGKSRLTRALMKPFPCLSPLRDTARPLSFSFSSPWSRRNESEKLPRRRGFRDFAKVQWKLSQALPRRLNFYGGGGGGEGRRCGYNWEKIETREIRKRDQIFVTFFACASVRA